MHSEQNRVFRAHKPDKMRGLLLEDSVYLLSLCCLSQQSAPSQIRRLAVLIETSKLKFETVRVTSGMLQMYPTSM
jgi:hypothetical protein